MSPNIVRSVCPYDCPDTCGLLVEVEDGRAVRVSGDPAHPLTRGFEEFAEKVLTGCAPGRMSPVCGLPDAVIERMAREFVAATAPFVRLGSGLTRYGNGRHDRPRHRLSARPQRGMAAARRRRLDRHIDRGRLPPAPGHAGRLHGGSGRRAW
jgi:hypothetical protein